MDFGTETVTQIEMDDDLELPLIENDSDEEDCMPDFKTTVTNEKYRYQFGSKTACKRP